MLPRNSDAQREQLVRRLAAGDDSIDIMSLDVLFAPELAQAGFLAPVPDDVAPRSARASSQGALQSATWDGKLVAVPFWANTQLLWYRKSVAKAAGLDMTKPVTWDQLVKAAQDQKKLLSAQGRRAESLTVWFNALIESAGGHIIAKNSTDPDKIKLGFDTPAGKRAGEVMHEVATRGRRPGLLDVQRGHQRHPVREPRRRLHGQLALRVGAGQQQGRGGHAEESVPDDYGWTLYPRVDENTPSAPPLGGINLGVAKFSHYADFAYQATECITSDENQADYMVTNGNPASRQPSTTTPTSRRTTRWPTPSGSPCRRQRPARCRRTTARSPGAAARIPPAGGCQRVDRQQADDLISAVLRGDQLL